MSGFPVQDVAASATVREGCQQSDNVVTAVVIDESSPILVKQRQACLTDLPDSHPDFWHSL